MLQKRRKERVTLGLKYKINCISKKKRYAFYMYSLYRDLTYSIYVQI